ncbi:MAG: hypothetical protein KC613_02980 [Myxococcales bacterium]|nr:hypothetical protein [Myxococcales bacterium]MCB9523343.1 hypothetical protein [Myxococcales bacterium]
MPTDYDKEFGRYVERFERLVGDLSAGQYGHYRGRLVRRFDPPQFRAKVDEYMGLGQRFTAMLNAGDTIDDTLAVELRAVEVELVLEKSLFLPS